MGSEKPRLNDLAPIKFAKAHPEKVVAEFLQSKTTNNLVRVRPEWDLARADPTGLHVAQRKTLFDTEQLLHQKRQYATEKRKELDECWKNMETSELQLRNEFINFCTFKNENEEKKQRAKKKLVQLQELAIKKSNDMDQLVQRYEFFIQIQEKLERHLKEHAMYQEYLQICIEKFRKLESIEWIVNRFEALVEARMIVTERHETGMSCLEEAKIKLMRMLNRNAAQLMGLHNVMIVLESKYETVKTFTLESEAVVSHIRNILAMKLEDFIEAKRSAWNLYVDICKTNGEDPIDISLEEQLLVIKKRVRELKKIETIVRKPLQLAALN